MAKNLRKLASFFILLHSMSFASVEVEGQHGGRTLLKANPCSEAIPQLQALIQWKTTLLEPLPDNSFPWVSGDETSCTYDITQLIPSALESKCDSHPICKGPNCFNACITLSKMTPAFRYAGPQEFNFWLESPLCSQVSSPSELRPGDIIAIRKKPAPADLPHLKEVHGFIYLTPELSFSKNGYLKNKPYRIMATEEVYDEYDLDLMLDAENCRIVKDPEKCPIYSQGFRCKSLDQYLSKSLKPSDELSSAQNQIHRIECIISDKAMGFPISTHNTQNIFLTLKTLEGITRKNLMKPDTHPKTRLREQEKILWNSIGHRIDSLTTQLKYINRHFYI